MGRQFLLPLGQFALLLLQLRLVILQLLAQGTQIADNALVVLGHFVDKVYTAQQIAEIHRLEQHGPEGGHAALLLIPHLLAEQFILLLLFGLIFLKICLQRSNLALSIFNLAAQNLSLLVQQFLLFQCTGLLSLRLFQLFVNLVRLLLMLRCLTLQITDGNGIGLFRPQRAAIQQHGNCCKHCQRAAKDSSALFH